MAAMTDALGFWSTLVELVSNHKLVIDRPKGSPHPRHSTSVYPLDYGYLHGTTSCDGGGIDVWLGSLSHRDVTGIICAVDLEQRDAELKVLVGCTPAEMETARNMHSLGGQSAILIERA
jgi:inorganic pyrophosphatase